MTILFYMILAILIIATLMVAKRNSVDYDEFLIYLVIGTFIDFIIIGLLLGLSPSEQIYKTHQIYNNNINSSVKIVTDKTKTTFESGKPTALSKAQIVHKMEDDEAAITDSLWTKPTGTLTMSKDTEKINRKVDIIVKGNQDANIVSKIDYGTVTRRKQLFGRWTFCKEQKAVAIVTLTSNKAKSEMLNLLDD